MTPLIVDNDQFGPLVSRWSVEQAIIGLLSSPPSIVSTTYPLIAYYLAEVERQTGLAPRTLPLPPGPKSYQGGVDALTLQAEWMPMVHVIVQPDGAAMMMDTGTYGQRFECQVVSTAGDDNENTARMVADHYAAAIAGIIAHHGSLGAGATGTTLVETGVVRLLDPEEARQVAQSSVVFSTLIAPMFWTAAPTVLPADPYQQATSWPTVQQVDVTVTARPIG